MFLEILAVIAGAIGGLAGVLTDTHDKETGRLTMGGWIALFVVIGAASLAGVKAYLNHNELLVREERERRLSYYALMNVYAPLSMLLDSSVAPPSRNDRSQTFPPNLGLAKYKALHDHKELTADLAKSLANGIADHGRTNFSLAANWSNRYRTTLSELDKTIEIYGSHITPETLQHLLMLKQHSLFRDGSVYGDRGEDRICAGSLADTTRQLGDPSLDQHWRDRCQANLAQQLSRLVQDQVPNPPFLHELEAYHYDYCKSVGYRRPYCSWAPDRRSGRNS